MINYDKLKIAKSKTVRWDDKVYYDYPKILAKGKKLLKMVPEKDNGQKGDIELTNKWAEALGVSDWFVWRKF